MSTDYSMVCFTCKETGPIFASSSIAYGYKVWDTEELRKWLGHRDSIGRHEGHDLRIVHEDVDLPWDDDQSEIKQADGMTEPLSFDGKTLCPVRALKNDCCHEYHNCEGPEVDRSQASKTIDIESIGKVCAACWRSLGQPENDCPEHGDDVVSMGEK